MALFLFALWDVFSEFWGHHRDFHEHIVIAVRLPIVLLPVPVHELSIKLKLTSIENLKLHLTGQSESLPWASMQE
jgi:hypothetical protein